MSSFESIIEQIQSKGERVTLQRRLVVEALCDIHGHTTIHDIQVWFEQKHPEHKLPDPTVYRILQRLKDLELVSQTDMGTSGIVYELLDQHQHHHLICLNCGSVTELNDHYLAPLRAALSADMGFQARIDHMAIYGICANCSTAIPAQ